MYLVGAKQVVRGEEVEGRGERENEDAENKVREYDSTKYEMRQVALTPSCTLHTFVLPSLITAYPKTKDHRTIS